MSRRVISWVAIVALVGAVLAGCSSSDSSGSPDGSTPAKGADSATADSSGATTSSPAPYAGKGPYVAGVTTLKLADGRDVFVWYPAQKGATSGSKETVVLPSFLSKELQAKIPADKQAPYVVDAYVDAAPDTAGAPYPIVLFSHGFAGYPEQSVNLTTHLAEWGFVVVAPEHVERSLPGLLGDHAAGVAKSDDATVLAKSLELVEQESQGDGTPLEDMVDPSKVAVTGHSAGAGAAYRLASTDPRVKAFITYSVGFGPEEGPAPPPPEKPGMVMLGTTDGIIPADTSRAIYEGMNKPKYLVEIEGAGHLVFSDICEVGKDQGGVTQIAKDLNLPIPDNLLKLGSDGCDSASLEPTKAFPAINQLSVAFLRYELGIDKEPKGLDTEAVADLGAPVTVTSDT